MVDRIEVKLDEINEKVDKLAYQSFARNVPFETGDSKIAKLEAKSFYTDLAKQQKIQSNIINQLVSKLTGGLVKNAVGAVKGSVVGGAAGGAAASGIWIVLP